MRKDNDLRVTLDAETAALLQAMADSEAEGNRSLMVRKLIREGQARRATRIIQFRQHDDESPEA
jgi:hypothetical protein